MWAKIFIPITYAFALLVSYETSAQDNVLQKTYEYTYSFKGPSMVQPDSTVPFWTLKGDALAGDDKIRLVPSIRDKKGLAWSKFPSKFKDWEIEVHIRIEGKGKLGADGLAIWYISQEGQLGHVFGAMDQWQGLGIFLDSFDNNNQMDNPSISVILNDGTKQFQHNNDGSAQESGRCKFDFRNKPYPVKVKARYERRILTISYTSGNFPNDEYYQPCTTIENVDLPEQYFFGVSAATGGLADDHDVIKFLTYSLTENIQPQGQVNEASINEHEKKMEDFNKMQEDFQKENPDMKEVQPLQSEQLYEGTASKELMSIFDVQNNLKAELRVVTDLIRQLMTQQNGVAEKLDVIQARASNLGSPEVPPAGADNNAKSYHIDNVMNLQRESFDTVKSIREELNYLRQIVNQINQRPPQRADVAGGVQPPAPESYEAIQFRQSVRGDLNKITSDLGIVMHRQSNAPKLVCPEPEMPSCISMPALLAVAAIQVIILIIYQSMRISREEAAKKFF